MAFESHHLEPVHAHLMNAAPQQLARPPASENQRNDFAAASRDDEMRIRPSARIAVMSLDDAEIARQFRLDQRSQVREARPEFGGHFSGGHGLPGVFAEDGAVQMIPQPNVQNGPNPSRGLAQNGSFRVSLRTPQT